MTWAFAVMRTVLWKLFKSKRIECMYTRSWLLKKFRSTRFIYRQKVNKIVQTLLTLLEAIKV